MCWTDVAWNLPRIGPNYDLQGEVAVLDVFYFSAPKTVDPRR